MALCNPYIIANKSCLSFDQYNLDLRPSPLGFHLPNNQCSEVVLCLRNLQPPVVANLSASSPPKTAQPTPFSCYSLQPPLDCCPVTWQPSWHAQLTPKSLLYLHPASSSPEPPQISNLALLFSLQPGFSNL